VGGDETRDEPVGARRRGATSRRVFCERGESRGSDVRVIGPSCGPLLQLHRASAPARAAYPPDSRPGSAPARAGLSLVPVRLLKRDARRTTRIAVGASANSTGVARYAEKNVLSARSDVDARSAASTCVSDAERKDLGHESMGRRAPRGSRRGAPRACRPVRA
jgi:hypothetical protein